MLLRYTMTGFSVSQTCAAKSEEKNMLISQLPTEIGWLARRLAISLPVIEIGWLAPRPRFLLVRLVLYCALYTVVVVIHCRSYPGAIAQVTYEVCVRRCSFVLIRSHFILVWLILVSVIPMSHCETRGRGNRNGTPGATPPPRSGSATTEAGQGLQVGRPTALQPPAGQHISPIT